MRELTMGQAMPTKHNNMANSMSVERRSATISARHRNQSGFTLIEVLVGAAIGVLITGALAAWLVGTLRAQDVTRGEVAAARIISMISADFVSDAAGAQFAVSLESAPAGGGAGAVTLNDCPGGLGSKENGATVLLVLVSPRDQRVVYTLDQSGDDSIIYRRTCPNDLALISPSTPSNDPSLNDPDFLEDQASSLPQATTVKMVVKRVATAAVDSVASTCPPASDSSIPVGSTVPPSTTVPPTPTASGADPNCQTVRLSIGLVGRSEPVIMEATRRTDTYCAPGCPPVARFSVSNVSPIKGQPVTLDARSSFDRRKDYYLDVNPPTSPVEAEGDVATRMHYAWSASSSDPNCSGGAVWATDTSVGVVDPPSPLTPGTPTNGDVLASITFQKACDYQVTLKVWNNSGISNSYTRTIKVKGIEPKVEILNTPVPIEIVRGQTVNFRSSVQTFEGDLDQTRSRWTWGDGTASVPLTPANLNGSPFQCPADGPTLCTTSNTSVPHQFNNAGTFVVVLTVTDDRNLSTSKIIQVVVKSEFLYVSKSHGNDNATCGTITPDFNPCKSIAYTFGRAATEKKTDIMVAGGSYAAFTAADGISVHGGRDDRDGSASSWLYSSDYPTVIPGEEASGSVDRRAITMDSLTFPTTIEDIVVEVGKASVYTKPVNGVVVNGSSNVMLRNVTVREGEGRNPTGILITAGSTVYLSDSNIKSGKPVQLDAADTGNRSAYGVRVLGGSALTIDGGTISAETGLAGVAGNPGANDPTSACAGLNGSNHSTDTTGACQAVSSSFGSTNGTTGGAGGDAGYCWSDPGKAGGSALGGSGGAGGYGATPYPKAGRRGLGGDGAVASGNGGAAGSATAAFAGALWAGPQAGTGGAATTTGVPGGGGGGGGGTHVCPFGWNKGQSGGGGGGGGRAGLNGGTGGYAGGGSFGVYAFDSTVSASNGAVVTAGKGGNGGAGGKGGSGGIGGKGGRGAATTDAGDASSGGGGGGGAGASGGGGGASGPSVGIFVGGGTATSPSTVGSTLTATGGAQPGARGAGGDGGKGGDGGDDPGSSGGMADNRTGQAGEKGKDGAKGLDGASGQAGMVCGLFVATGGTDDCFASSVKTIARTTAKATNAGGAGGSLSWLVTFDDDDVTGVLPSHFSLTGTGIDNLSGLGIAVTGVGKTRTVTVSGITAPSGHGRLALNLNEDVTGILNGGGQQIEAPRPAPFPGESYDIDQEKPRVTSIARNMDQLTNATAVSWMVTFSEPVSGVDGGNFTYTTAGGAVTGMYPTAANMITPSVWEIVINSGSGSGILGLDLTNATGIVDAVGNGLNLDDLPFAGDTYDIDKVPPQVTEIRRDPPGTVEPTNEQTVTWLVKFSEPITGIFYDGANANFTLNPTVTAAKLTSLTLNGAGDHASITADTGTGDGPLRLNLSAIAQLKDFAGNSLKEVLVGDDVGHTPAPRPNEPYLIDKTAPEVISIKRATGAGEFSNSTTTLDYIVTFSEPVWNVLKSQFSLAPTMVGASVDLVTGADGTATRSIQVKLNGAGADLTDSGKVQVNLTNAGAPQIRDIAYNTMLTGHVGDEMYQIDRTRPDAPAASTPPNYWQQQTNPAWQSSYTKWHNGPTTVTFAGTDPTVSGVSSGVGQVCYTTDGSDPLVSATCLTHSDATPAELPVSDLGETRIRYYVVDRAGNRNSTVQDYFVRIDTVAPTSKITVTSFSEEAGKLIGFARVKFEDPGDVAGQSPVRGTWYTVTRTYVDSNGVTQTTTTSPTWVEFADPGAPGSKPAFLRQNGNYVIKYYSIDWAGNAQAEQTRAFELETRGPKITSVTLSPGTATGCSPQAQVYNVPSPDPTGVETYTNDGCVKLTAQGVESLDETELPVARVRYYRCGWTTPSCIGEDPNENLIGTVNRNATNDLGLPVADSNWTLFTKKFPLATNNTPVDNMGFVVVAAVEDKYDVMSTQSKRTGLDMTPPSAPSAPQVNGRS